MSIMCPVLNRRVTYLDCNECEDKVCRSRSITGQNSIQRGDILFVRNDSNTVGSEQSGDRPAIIVSNNKCNRFSGVVEVVYLTTALKRPLPTHIKIYSASVLATALCEAVYSVSVDRLGHKCGRCTQEEMERIDDALRISLSL